MTSSKNWRANQQEAIDDESKIDFKGMKFEFEYQLAMSMRAFINARIFGLDFMDSSMDVIEGKLPDAYKDEQYKQELASAAAMLERTKITCKTKDGFDVDRYNQAIHDSIMLRWHAVNELLFRKHMAPQLAEYGVLD